MGRRKTVMMRTPGSSAQPNNGRYRLEPPRLTSTHDMGRVAVEMTNQHHHTCGFRRIQHRKVRIAHARNSLRPVSNQAVYNNWFTYRLLFRTKRCSVNSIVYPGTFDREPGPYIFPIV